MSATYPGAIYAPRAKVNFTGVVYDEADTDRIFAEDVSKDDAEIVAIQTELGTDPAGASATVKDRLEVIEGDIGDLESDKMSNPMTTAGDIIIGGASGAPARLAKGDDGEVLKLVSGVPSWETGGGAPDYSCRVELAETFALASDTWTEITGWASESFDTDTMHDNSTNPARITFTNAGKYCFGGTLSFVTGTTNDVTGIKIINNDSKILASQCNGNYINNAYKSVSCSGIFEFEAGDYIIVQGYSRSGVDILSTTTNIWAYLISE